MTAPSPLAALGPRIAFAVEVDGAPIDSTYEVISIDTWVSMNKIPRAQIVLYDGAPAERDFPISNKKTFLPGAAVKIKAGYGDAKDVLFEGIIIKHGVEITGTEGSKLTLDLCDKAIKMTVARKSAAFQDITDSDLIGKLIGASSLKKDVESTTAKHERVVQFYATDWDLMLTRAEANGLVVTVAAGKVTVKKPDTSQSAALRVEYGESILDFQAELDAVEQLTKSAIKGYAWDSAKQELINAGPGAVSVTEAGNITSDKLAKVLGVDAYPRQSGAPLSKDALTGWSTAELLRARLGKIRGHVRFFGSALAKCGKTIELAGVGDRFNGTHLIGGVHHGLRDGAWLTTVTFGLSPRPFASEAPRIAAPDASGQLPPVKGLQTGIVKQVAKDPLGEFRVLVTLPLLQEEKGVWARLGTFYASDKVGALFYPEKGDEVIVGFMNEDPRYPVILGSVYSKKRAPPEAPDEKNTKKAIVTRSKVKITITDDDKSKPIIEITTPNGRKLKMDDKGESILLTDGDNKVTLSKSGISMESQKDIKLKATGNISMEATGNVKVKATADASIEGLNVNAKAQVGLSAQGSATAELKASGVLTIQGALVKIN